jgi:ABC-type polysaccharide/polyol phosphate export permease
MSALSVASTSRTSTPNPIDLLVALTSRDLRMRYQGTIFGYLWWISRPIALGAVLYFTMGRVVRLDIDNYGVFLLSALFPWFWFQGAVGEGAGAFIANAGLITRVVFPRVILPIASVLYHSAQFVMTLPILIVFVYVAGGEAHISWIYGLPLLFAVQMFLVIGIALFLASLYVFIRDVGPILDITLLLTFYLSPIIYDKERIPENLQQIILLNPLVPLLEAWRALFLSGEAPGLDLWPTLAFGCAVFVIGLYLFRKMEKHFVDAL